MIQREIRSFLVEQKIQMPSKKTGTILFHPQCASLEDVQKFKDGQVCGPDKADILMAWHQSLSLPWNHDAIILLAEEALKFLKTGKTRYDKSWLELPELVKQIMVSPKQTKRTMSSSSISLDGPCQQRRSRKISVSKIVWQL